MNAGAVGRLVRNTRDAWASHAGDGGPGFLWRGFRNCRETGGIAGAGYATGVPADRLPAEARRKMGAGEGMVVDRSPEVHEAAGQRAATAGGCEPSGDRNVVHFELR